MKNLKFVLAGSVVLAFALACGGGGGEEAAGGGDMDIGTQFAVEAGGEDLVKVEAAIAAGDPDSVMFTCAAVDGYSEAVAASEAQAAKDFIAKAKKVCGYDQPISTCQVNLKKLADAGAKPDDFNTDCINVEMALDTLMKDHAADAKVGELKTAYEGHCGTYEPDIE